MRYSNALVLGSLVSKDGRSYISWIIMPSPLSHCRVMSQDPSSWSHYPPLGGIWSRCSQQSGLKARMLPLSYRGRAIREGVISKFLRAFFFGGGLRNRLREGDVLEEMSVWRYTPLPPLPTLSDVFCHHSGRKRCLCTKRRKNRGRMG